jgi:hypothetical protein
MSKLLSLLAACTLALAAGGFVSAADESNMGGQTRQSETTPGNADQRAEEYLAALKKCEVISNAGDRQKCVDAAKKKYSQM